MNTRARAWINFFSLAGLDVSQQDENLNQRPIRFMELTLEPLNALTCSLLYIYAMETHLHAAITRCQYAPKDEVIANLGPFLHCLNIIVGDANLYREDDVQASLGPAAASSDE